MNLNEPIFTLATEEELRDLSLLSIMGEVIDNTLALTNSDAIYSIVLSVELEIDVISDMCEWRANRIVKLCQTGQ